MEAKTIKLGQEFSQEELKLKFKAIYGGVAWPGKRPGFAVVTAMGHAEHFDNFDIFLLDEYESFDMRELVRQCGVLDFKYLPSLWFGDGLNNAADLFIKEMNRETENKEQERLTSISLSFDRTTNIAPLHRRQFNVCPTPILDMHHPFPYILPKIKRLLDKERRQLFMEGSKILDYLAGIQTQEISSMEFGEFPAIEALGFAVIEMRQYGSQINLELPTETDTAQSYSMRTAV